MSVALILLFASAEPMVTITVAQDRDVVPAHEITIETLIRLTPVSPAERETMGWRATRTSDRGVETVTTETCPALREVALSLADLPPIVVDPPILRLRNRAEPMPPTRKDGYSTRLTFTTRTDDGSWADVQVRGGNAYAAWGHDAVARLIPCWGPL